MDETSISLLEHQYSLAGLSEATLSSHVALSSKSVLFRDLVNSTEAVVVLDGNQSGLTRPGIRLALRHLSSLLVPLM